MGIGVVELPLRLADLHATYEREVATPDGSLFASISVSDLQDPLDGSWLRSMSVRDLTEVALARRALEELVASKTSSSPP